MHISRKCLLKQVTVYTNNETGITSFSYCYTFKPDRLSFIDGMTLSLFWNTCFRNVNISCHFGFISPIAEKQNNEGQNQSAENRETELNESWDTVAGDLSAMLQEREDIPQNVIPFDAASEQPVEEQRWTSCLFCYIEQMVFKNLLKGIGVGVKSGHKRLIAYILALIWYAVP